MDRQATGSVTRRLGIILLILLLIYVSSYAVLSRRGLVQSQAIGAKGLHFFPPEDTDSWRKWNYGCVILYFPLIAIETWLGTSEGAACEPMWRLSGNDVYKPTECREQPVEAE